MHTPLDDEDEVSITAQLRTLLRSENILEADETPHGRSIVLTDIQLERIVRVAVKVAAREAARDAVELATKNFYTAVGKSVVQRGLLYLGIAVVGFAVAKGWLPFDKVFSPSHGG
jgi:hypothetical protein